MEGAQCPYRSSTGTQSTRGKPQLSVVCGCSHMAQALAAPPRPAPIPTALPAPPAAAGCGFRRLGWGYTQARSLPGPPGQRDQALTPLKATRSHGSPSPGGHRKARALIRAACPLLTQPRDVAFHLTYIWWELWGGKGICGVVGKE